MLGKYLLTALFDWRQVSGEPKEGYPAAAPWIDVAPTGGAYDPDAALNALQGIIEGKLAKYGRLPDGSRLLVHYGRGWVYNTPFRGLNIRSFADVARWASEMLACRAASFERVYLVEVLEDPGPAAFQIYPQLVSGDQVSV